MPEACTIALQGHGSKRNPASRQATEQVAGTIEQSAAVAKVAAAFLEEPPFLEETAAAIVGPTVVLGLFSGESLHGAKDAPMLVAGPAARSCLPASWAADPASRTSSRATWRRRQGRAACPVHACAGADTPGRSRRLIARQAI